MFPNYFI